jgi:hypothetical protein
MTDEPPFALVSPELWFECRGKHVTPVDPQGITASRDFPFKLLPQMTAKK